MKVAALTASGLLTMLPVERPPVQYQPSDPITVRVTFAPRAWVDTECRKRVGRDPAPGHTFIGCAGRAHIILPNGCEYADGFATLVCHEVGHVQGWDHG